MTNSFLERAKKKEYRKEVIGFNPFNSLHRAGGFMKSVRGGRINRFLMGGHEFDRVACTGCRICARLCPTRAISFSGGMMQYRNTPGSFSGNSIVMNGGKDGDHC